MGFRAFGFCRVSGFYKVPGLGYIGFLGASGPFLAKSFGSIFSSRMAGSMPPSEETLRVQRGF